MVDIDESRSAQLSTVVFLATLLVLLCHVEHWAQQSNFVIHYFGDILPLANVSNFFFLSGFFLAKGCARPNWHGRAVGKRLKTIGVPYLAWGVVYAGLYFLFGLVGLLPRSSQYLDPRYIWGFGVPPPFPLDLPMWYLRMLMLFVVVSPLFLPPMRRNRRWAWFFIPAMLAVSFLFPKLATSMAKFHFLGFACFLLGAQMAFSERWRNFILEARNGRWWLWTLIWALAAGLVACLVDPPHEGVEISRWAATLKFSYVVLAVVCLQRLVACSRWRAPESWVKITFVIYGLHWIVIEVLTKIGLDAIRKHPTLMFFVVFALTSAICLTVGLALRRFVPRIASCLTGGRS